MRKISQAFLSEQEVKETTNETEYKDVVHLSPLSQVLLLQHPSVMCRLHLSGSLPARANVDNGRSTSKRGWNFGACIA